MTKVTVVKPNATRRRMESQTAISQEKATAPTPDSDASDASDKRQRDEDDDETKQQGPVDENNFLNECVD
ncbi:unnamed protein product [Phytophthora fragariaefolia]|uniref:Unnamed protein product n=1 Tax=Phytophthora fragariaefolia TaxID=1490495 RepID=A0A9W6X2M8_9STRA|nr:unnamed protein product [Phytophthora fragariaefolia]